MSSVLVEGLTAQQRTSEKLTDSADISIKVEFGGGLEILFANQRSYNVKIPAAVPSGASTAYDFAKLLIVECLADLQTKPVDVSYLLFWLRDNLLKERVELFLDGQTMYVPLLYDASCTF